jgi:MFS family permease
MGASTSAIQQLMPNQVRALASSIFLFLINIIGLGGGPFLVGFFTDTVFNDEKAIRYSLAATIAIGGMGAILFYFIAAKAIAKRHREKQAGFMSANMIDQEWKKTL